MLFDPNLNEVEIGVLELPCVTNAIKLLPCEIAETTMIIHWISQNLSVEYYHLDCGSLELQGTLVKIVT